MKFPKKNYTIKNDFTAVSFSKRSWLEHLQPLLNFRLKSKNTQNTTPLLHQIKNQIEFLNFFTKLLEKQILH